MNSENKTDDDQKQNRKTCSNRQKKSNNRKNEIKFFKLQSMLNVILTTKFSKELFKFI